ncbi:DUF222 domain-containing protein [Cellulomonas sp. APG4]|uniref:HNH endonuclease signature motif containing protein n=1 Tax=Cellulomonas sp. APG4 TaxID=1538656 RepID=UPI00137A3BFF|nr:HNH endonuclease signature motif containing protein [Cellulomonas sp. APG4]NCT90664.1 DUF222 domain-containing protein [Cellulomonas sp. APG4]
MSLVPHPGPSELMFAAEVVRARPRVPQPAAWADRHPVAARLEDRAPDPELVTELASLEPGDLDDATLLEVVAGWERAIAWAAARQAAAAAEVERRAGGARLEAVADEIAVRLATSRRSAEQLVDRGRALAHLPEVHDALAAGLLDVRKADALVRETRHRSFEDARKILTQVLPTAPSRTAPQLRAAVRRAEAALDPAALRVRHTRARGDRCVRMTPAPDAMAWVTAFLPATDAMTVMTAVDAIAASVRPEDDRSVDARRADALTDVMRRVLDAGVGPDGPLPVRRTRRPHLQVTVPLTGLHADDVAELAGYGAIPTVLVHESLHDATLEPVVIDPRTGEIAGPAQGWRRSPTPRSSHEPSPATRTSHEASPDEPPRHERIPRERAPGEPPRHERTPRERAPGEPPPGEPSTREESPPSPSLASSAPGPAAPSRARGSAERSPDTIGYRPGAALARLVIERDVTCTFPGCQVPSSRCDLDHIEPFDSSRPADTQTRAENLHALCRHHHRLKTHHGWTPVRDPTTGSTTWTSPLGRRYARPPAHADPAATAE